MLERYEPKSTDTSFLVPLSSEVAGHYDYDYATKLGLLHLEPGFEYPTTPISPAVDAMLLERHDQQTLIVPDNFITLGQALNDASGSGGDHIGGAQKGRDILEKLAVTLAEAANEGFVPRELTYEKVLYSREDEAFKLLPPLDMQAFEIKRFKSVAKRHVESSLWQSLQQGAETDVQREFIVSAFGGFVERFQL